MDKKIDKARAVCFLKKKKNSEEKEGGWEKKEQQLEEIKGGFLYLFFALEG